MISFFSAAFKLIPFSLFLKKKWNAMKIMKAVGKAAALGIALCGYFPLYTEGVSRLPVSQAVTLNYFWPIFHYFFKNIKNITYIFNIFKYSCFPLPHGSTFSSGEDSFFCLGLMGHLLHA
jgi:drug/metabolite transporter (DMT)-like permease